MMETIHGGIVSRLSVLRPAVSAVRSVFGLNGIADATSRVHQADAQRSIDFPNPDTTAITTAVERPPNPALAPGLRKSECLLLGPYIELDPGHYTVKFEILGTGNGELGYVDVCCDVGQTILCQKLFSGADCRNSITLEFTAPRRGQYEFRVFAFEGQVLKVRGRSLSGRYNDGEIAIDEFHLQNFSLIKQIIDIGGSFKKDADVYVLDFRDILLAVHGREDLLVVNEILIHNSYDFLLKKPCCVIDIGMNVGVASLFFASLPHVREVHSFEPFPVPFGRALRNLGLNPQLANKISPRNVGLGKTTANHTVLYDSASTLGVSIRGQGRGESITIAIEAASQALRDVFRRAQDNGLEIVMKVDCEGSEFAIFDDLSASGLIDIPKVYLVEWHKWWSTDLRDTDLIRPLSHRGYVVLNQTNLMSPIGGLIYAAR